MFSEADCIGGIVFYFCNQRVKTVEQKVWIELVLQGGVTNGLCYFLFEVRQLLVAVLMCSE